MTSKSREIIYENLKLLNRLKTIDFSCKSEYEVVNKAGDDLCKAIFNNSKYLSDLEVLSLWSI